MLKIAQFRRIVCRILYIAYENMIEYETANMAKQDSCVSEAGIHIQKVQSKSS